jgi:hypothetical protein
MEVCWRRGRIAQGLWACAITFFFAIAGPLSITTEALDSSCPLNFTVLNRYSYVADQGRVADSTEKRCLTLRHGLEIVLSQYLQETDYFLVPTNTADSCIQAYELQLQSQQTTVNLSSLCGIVPSTISRGTDNCQGIQTKAQFRNATESANVFSYLSSCNGVLSSGNTRTATCAACIKAASMVASALHGSGTDSCLDYTNMYISAEVAPAGPTDATTLVCLWGILAYSTSNSISSTLIAVSVVAGLVAIFAVSSCIAAFFWWRRRRNRLLKNNDFVRRTTEMLEGSIGGHGGLTWFTIEELKTATHNFGPEMIIGQGGFGNVYKGVLATGSEVACKRFKNFTPAGNPDFVREVEALASVRHKNLVSLRGCCVASLGSGLKGYQRIIVFDFIRNGSLQDYLFNVEKPSLTWLQRRKIATDTARGVEYLHHGAQKQILHRDIKPSNILLDSDFNAMVADFGLVKFAPDGVTHITTCVAGSFGYVAPEYALYNQLTDRSDVYSYGIVLLELISGRKAMNPDSASDQLINDWAWYLVKEGKWLEVIDVRLETAGIEEDLEWFVMLALLCAHPHVVYRPSMTAVLRMLESDHLQELVVPDRPIPLTSDKDSFRLSLLSPNFSRSCDLEDGGVLSQSSTQGR